MPSRRVAIAGAALAAALCAGAAVVVVPRGREVAWSLFTRLRGRATVADRLAAMDPAVARDVRRWCADAGIAHPPAEVALVALKRERVLHLVGRGDPQAPDGWRLLATLPILGASGTEGPKLREGDGQVPEGVYAVESLNPNSRHHLALRVGYPGAFDQAMARQDGRANLGGDIMIHGGSLSIGCVAIGDEAIERAFMLAADAGPSALRVVIAPCDLRTQAARAGDDQPSWLPDLHARLASELGELLGPASGASAGPRGGER